MKADFRDLGYIPLNDKERQKETRDSRSPSPVFKPHFRETDHEAICAVLEADSAGQP
jgi:hypothetical protein